MKPRKSAIPTPGRSRSSSSAAQPVPTPDVDYMSKAFSDAIRANDPALHRGARASDASIISGSPQSTSFPPRPPSIASSTSTRPPERAKTPTTRPPSRHSDIFGKSIARSSPRAFDLGDNVRIESLGFEGILRYLGGIDDKPGVWAGVELSGGFYGKGKNEGSVNGKQYFSCPPKCGVFVASTKLSAPTVGPGAISRPSSVASSRGGRNTPSISGRTTPSSVMSLSTSSRTPSSALSTGRRTPSQSGRITPSYLGRVTPGTTPSARKPPMKSTRTPGSLSDKLTAGSRASKYVAMTAKQLSTRDSAIRPIEPPSPRQQPSPSRISSTASSPTRTLSSPFGTPKPSLGGRLSTPGSTGIGRPALITPRARIPSAIAMPPPASPVARTLPEASSRPDSASSNQSVVFGEERAQLQSRIEALEYDNGRLRAAADTTSELKATEEQMRQIEEQMNAARSQAEDAQRHASELEHKLGAIERTLADRDAQLLELDAERNQKSSALEQQLQEAIVRADSLQQQYAQSAVSLRETISARDTAERDSESKFRAKDAEVASLELRLKGAQTHFEEERRELGAQVDELRQAGQETIALYEERLSEADRERYDLEARITTLESRASARSPSPALTTKTATSSATEIDNETLREQVVHLQRKISKLEDALEDAQAAQERDEAALADRMRRLKEKEEAMKKELTEGRKEVERTLKSEGTARRRLEEIEEALHESTAALEDARAEVEGLRTELMNLDGLVTGNGDTGDLYSRVALLVTRASSDRSSSTSEIAHLQELLKEARRKELDAVQDAEQSRDSLSNVRSELETLKNRTTDRDGGLNNDIQRVPERSPASTKHDLSAAKDEITGLKHIVQELQKENLSAAQQNKLLQSENQLLASEAEQLRQEMQVLEENLDNSLIHEASDVSDAPMDIPSLQKLLREQKLRSEIETDQLHKRLMDSEMKMARVSHDIYHEDELEQELEHLKAKLEYQTKSSKQSNAVDNKRASLTVSHVSDGDLVCSSSDMVELPHENLFCEDCETHGHTAANCPHSLDVF
ncbi:unnamed protein product [Mycena citricolor]|uniref:CAP-Gly domain-containing protein n=1 Tax=Mycena citricolor TaxID=2018698 RepID=A0AAD2GZF3_9AGAR|nr:unnamed protein product [Mycena citricolor]CAK5281463.1 unnamed protein product [Mycena citricolor]